MNGTYSPQVLSVSPHLLLLSDKKVKTTVAKLRTILSLGGLNLVQILRDNAFHLPISRIIQAAKPTHHHVVRIDKVGGLSSVAQP